jgi:CHASE3 domain sensor protein
MIVKNLKEENDHLKEIINQLSANTHENYEVKLKNENLLKELNNSKINEYDQKVKLEDVGGEVNTYYKILECTTQRSNPRFNEF